MYYRRETGLVSLILSRQDKSENTAANKIFVGNKVSTHGGGFYGSLI